MSFHPAVQQVGTVQRQSRAGVGTLTLPNPGVIDGDALLAFGGWRRSGTGPTITVPAGWTPNGGPNWAGAGTRPNGTMWHRQASGEPADWTWDLGVNGFGNDFIIVLFGLRGFTITGWDSNGSDQEGSSGSPDTLDLAAGLANPLDPAPAINFYHAILFVDNLAGDPALPFPLSITDPIGLTREGFMSLWCGWEIMNPSPDPWPDRQLVITWGGGAVDGRSIALRRTPTLNQSIDVPAHPSTLIGRARGRSWPGDLDLVSGGGP